MPRSKPRLKRRQQLAKRQHPPSLTAPCAGCGRRVVKAESVSTGRPEGGRYVERYYCPDCAPAAAARWAAEHSGQPATPSPF